MRNQDEIQKAHDRYAATILGEIPNPFGEDHKKFLIAACDVLCWVLEHDHNHSFEENLQKLIEAHEAVGIHPINYGN